MKCIVYVSKGQVDFDDQSLAELADYAANQNTTVGITGYLYFENNLFTQYIEGDADPIAILYNSIYRDHRHVVLTSQESELSERRFTDWSMRLLQKNEFIEIQLEHILTDFLMFATRIPDANLRDPKPLWRMVDSLALLQKRLASGSAQLNLSHQYMTTKRK